jgi:hypothetical protein
MEAKLAVPNAILFVFDPSNKGAIVPQYDSSSPVAATSSCVSVATLADVDGDVTVRLLQLPNNSHPAGLIQVFDDQIETPGRVLSVVTSQFDRILETGVPSPVTRITIAVDDPKSPAVISVNASPG